MESKKVTLTVQTAKSTFRIIKSPQALLVELADGEVTECKSYLDAWNVIDKEVRKSLSPKMIRHKHGEYGWVKLSDDELSRLYDDLGVDEVNRCIAHVDESAETTGNKNKWKNWNLVIRKCHREGWHKSRYRAEEQISDSSYDMAEFKSRADILPVYTQ